MELTLPSPVSADIFSHLRVIEGMFVSLAMSRILATLVQYIQFPREHKPNLLHISWLLVLIIMVLNWWWGLFSNSDNVVSTYKYYFFSILTPLSFFFLAALMSPGDKVSEGGFYAYFLDIRGWFFAFILFGMITDPAEVFLTIESENGTIDLSLYAQIVLVLLVALLFMFTLRSRSYRVNRFVALAALLLSVLILISNILG